MTRREPAEENPEAYRRLLRAAGPSGLARIVADLAAENELRAIEAVVDSGVLRHGDITAEVVLAPLAMFMREEPAAKALTRKWLASAESGYPCALSSASVMLELERRIILQEHGPSIDFLLHFNARYSEAMGYGNLVGTAIECNNRPALAQILAADPRHMPLMQEGRGRTLLDAALGANVGQAPAARDGWREAIRLIDRSLHRSPEVIAGIDMSYARWLNATDGKPAVWDVSILSLAERMRLPALGWVSDPMLHELWSTPLHAWREREIVRSSGPVTRLSEVPLIVALLDVDMQLDNYSSEVTRMFLQRAHEIGVDFSAPLWPQHDDPLLASWTLLHWLAASPAANLEPADVVHAITLGADPFARDAEGATPALLSLRYGHYEIRPIFLAAQARQASRSAMLQAIRTQAGPASGQILEVATTEPAVLRRRIQVGARR